jgi:hypothetical protein
MMKLQVVGLVLFTALGMAACTARGSGRAGGSVATHGGMGPHGGAGHQAPQGPQGPQGGPPPGPGPATQPGDACGQPLQGTIHGKPFVPGAAFGHREPNQYVINVFDRPVDRSEGCKSGTMGFPRDSQVLSLLVDRWPLPPGSLWTSTSGDPNPNLVGIFLWHQKPVDGNRGTRAAGEMRVLTASATGGEVCVTAGNTQPGLDGGAVVGFVKGRIAFTSCD